MAQVVVEGLRELRQALRKAAPEADKEVRGAQKQSADIVLNEARKAAPKGTRPLPKEGKNRRTRRLAQGGRVVPGVRGTSIVWSSKQFPHAGVNHWGGTISPGGVDIVFKKDAPGRRFLWNAAGKNQPRFEQALERDLNAVFRRLGW